MEGYTIPRNASRRDNEYRDDRRGGQDRNYDDHNGDYPRGRGRGGGRGRGERGRGERGRGGRGRGSFGRGSARGRYQRDDYPCDDYDEQPAWKVKRNNYDDYSRNDDLRARIDYKRIVEETMSQMQMVRNIYIFLKKNIVNFKHDR